MVRRVTIFALALLALTAPTAANAANPAVDTGRPSSVTQTGATLNGTITPRGNATTYFFEYGATRLFGAQTPETPVAGGGRVRLSAPITGLAPDTMYHYRLVARANGRVRVGERRTFRTRREPRGVTLAANPTRVAPGGMTTLSGALTGSGDRAGKQVVLQSNPFPYTQGFVNVGNPIVTDQAGAFSFPNIAIGVTTQFRLRYPERDLNSPIVVVDAALQVKTSTARTRSGRGSSTYRFSGTITPAAPGAEVVIQKLRAGVWTTVRATVARGGGTASSYKRKIRIYRSGDFRIVVNAAGPYSVGIGRTVALRAP